MNQRRYLIRGALLLTLAGLLTRIAGFFYKIFLSRTIGAKEIGLFQLTLPVFAFCMAASCGGIQTAISRCTAEYYAKKDRRMASRILVCGIILSGGLSLLCAAGLFLGAPFIAARFLLEPACAPLLRILAISLPFAVLHNCVNGYFLGRKNVPASAAAQLTEQMLRITAVFFFYVSLTTDGRKPGAAIMALGQLAGEFAATVFCALYLWFSKSDRGEPSTLSACARAAAALPLKFSAALCAQKDSGSPGTPGQKPRQPHPGTSALVRSLLIVSVPLGLNRILMCVLQGIETSLLPQQLRLSGLSAHDALSVCGTLTGMALPLILFPTAVTAALGTLLLPAVSEAQALGKEHQISSTVNASFFGSIVLGLFCLAAFALFGEDAGTVLFGSTLAGSLIRRMALVCPFLYLNTTLAGILHGLGKSTAILLWNVCSSLLRLAAVVLFVPGAGIDAYVLALMLGQILTSVLTLAMLRRLGALTVSIPDSVRKPGLIALASGCAVCILRLVFPALTECSALPLAAQAMLYTALFALGCALLLVPHRAE